MTNIPNFNDLTPPDELFQKWCGPLGGPSPQAYTVTLFAYRAGARHGYAIGKQEWPEPITHRPPTEEDGDSFEDVQILTPAGLWKVAHWSSAQLSPWLHTTRWQPRPEPTPVDTLAAIIREVGAATHRLGAGALAEAILAHPAFPRALEASARGEGK